MDSPACFVSMPFGKKRSFATERDYDFDLIYALGIAPAAKAAGVQPIRDDADLSAGLMHRALFERIVHAEVLIADVTTANPNVFYELGIRHALRPHVTIVIGDIKEPQPLDTVLVRMIPYDFLDGSLLGGNGREFQAALTSAIREGLVGGQRADSPVYTLLDYNPLSPSGLASLAQNSAQRRPLVFLSYAREDQDDAIKLYTVLRDQGFDAWIDQRSISPGEKWELAIDTAIRKADFVLVCLSKKSVSKRGYLRKEIILALERSKEMLETDIFLIPVRLDKCEVPRELSQHQWFDLFAASGWEPLVLGLREGMKRRSG